MVSGPEELTEGNWLVHDVRQIPLPDDEPKVVI